MSRHTIQSDSSKDEAPENCLQSYQCVWMSHWTQTRLKSVDHVHNQLSNCYESGENSHGNKLRTSLSGSEVEPYSSIYMKEFREMNKVVLMNESSGTSCKILRPEGSLPLKIGEPSRQREEISKSKLDPKSGCDASLGPTDKSLFSMLKRTPIKPEIQLTESLFQSEGITSIPEKPAISNKFLRESRVDISSHVQHDILGPTSAGLLSEFNCRRTPVESFSPRQEYLNQPSSNFFVHEGKIGKNVALSIHNPETSNSCHRDFLGQQFQNVTNYGSCPVRPSRLSHKSSEVPRNPSFVHESQYPPILKENHQPLDTSTESEGKEKIENVNTTVDLKNESSAETDTMDMDMLQKNRLLDVAPSFANKDINKAHKSPTFEGALVSAKEKSRGTSPNLGLPDINQELPPIPTAASSTDDGDTSTSKTHNDPLELDPCSRWVKRLKPSSSDCFAHGTKSSKMVEASSHEKVNKFFSKLLNGGKSSSEPKISKSFHKEHVMTDKRADFQRNVESPSVEPVRRGQEKPVSHAWIQRWCHNPVAPLHKHNGGGACKPLNSRAIPYNIHKKQYPSIAAMALMGKAMSGFRPCELRKEESYMAWNNQGLR
ncbi:F-box family protein [Euphorbia peplus]|nr:F-box family protein [Euphorbia peplus]